MSREEVETTLIKFLRREPFQPFVIDLADGRRLQVGRRCIAIGGGGATMWTPDDMLEEFWFEDVWDIRPIILEAAS